MQTVGNPVKNKHLVVVGNSSKIIIDVCAEERRTMDARNAVSLGWNEVRLLATQVFQLRSLIDTHAKDKCKIEILKQKMII